MTVVSIPITVDDLSTSSQNEKEGCFIVCEIDKTSFVFVGTKWCYHQAYTLVFVY